jgi:hypothetical protein
MMTVHPATRAGDREIMDETPQAPARVGNAPGTLLKTWLVAAVLGVPLGVLLGIVVGLPGLLIGAGIGVWVASRAFRLAGTWPYLVILVATMFTAIIFGVPIIAVVLNRMGY